MGATEEEETVEMEVVEEEEEEDIPPLQAKAAERKAREERGEVDSNKPITKLIENKTLLSTLAREHV